jgi:gamma-glutamyl-gamma-aminobutyrate hydrolase PuuD
VSLPEARFVVGVQWHPEYRVLENPLSRGLFGMFAEACFDTSYAGVAVSTRAA